MKKLIVAAALLMVSACGTIQGMGRDVQSLGHGVTYSGTILEKAATPVAKPAK